MGFFSKLFNNDMSDHTSSLSKSEINDLKELDLIIKYNEIWELREGEGLSSADILLETYNDTLLKCEDDIYNLPIVLEKIGNLFMKTKRELDALKYYMTALYLQCFNQEVGYKKQAEKYITKSKKNTLIKLVKKYDVDKETLKLYTTAGVKELIPKYLEEENIFDVLEAINKVLY